MVGSVPSRFYMNKKLTNQALFPRAMENTYTIQENGPKYKLLELVCIEGFILI